MKSQGTHVLIVGIDRYESRDLPRLRGSRNDAVEWYRFCVRRLQVPPENIAVLANPPLTPRDLGPEAERSRLRGASHDEMVDEAKRLADAVASSSTEAAGLMTFSGHGLALGPDPGGVAGADLALCPVDVAFATASDGDLTISGALRFAELAAIFRAQSSRDNITVILDTCYSDGPTGRLGNAVAESDQAAAVRSSGRAQEGMERARQILRVDSFTNRLILGTHHWMPAYEIEVGGRWRGAASFALQTMMERWKTEVENGARCLDVSHSDLLVSTRNLLGVLGVDQVPTLWGARRLDELPVLRSGLKFVPGETSEHPNAVKRKRQCPIDPENTNDPVTYVFSDSSGNVLLQVVAMGYKSVTDGNGHTWTANKEYWFLAVSDYQTVLSADSLTMTGDALTTSELPPPGTSYKPSEALLTCTRNIGASAWNSDSYNGNPDNATLFTASDPSKSGEQMGLQLNFNNGGSGLYTIWFKSYLPSDGKAFEWGSLPSPLTNQNTTSTKSLGDGANYWYKST